ncbi:MAG: transcription termination/antitermination NusG family protein [Candidatus Pelethousia sp.]|nr:transcription termination/antitermination NusG family protein [Candidatus Pelethousia sp.]
MIGHCRRWIQTAEIDFKLLGHHALGAGGIGWIPQVQIHIACSSFPGTSKKSYQSTAGHVAFAPRIVRWKPAANGIRKVTCQLLPGYVFFDADTTPDWTSIRASESVLRILQYGDGEKALHGSDNQFAAWLIRHGGILEISHAIQVGAKLEFMDGPLKDITGKVVKVNKNRKQVQIALGDETSILPTIWCSMEFIEINTNGIE